MPAFATGPSRVTDIDLDSPPATATVKEGRPRPRPAITAPRPRRSGSGTVGTVRQPGTKEEGPILRSLILVGALASATTGSVLVVEAAPASADTPPLTAAQHRCGHTYDGRIFATPLPAGAGYMCVFTPSSPSRTLTPARQQCEHAYKGIFVPFALGYRCSFS
jgi:hypothetical protein